MGSVNNKNIILSVLSATLIFVLFSCGSNDQKSNDNKAKIRTLTAEDKEVREIINSLIVSSEYKNGTMFGTKLNCTILLDEYYRDHQNGPIWSDSSKFNNAALQLMGFIDTSSYAGLIKEHYHFKELEAIKKSISSSLDSKPWLAKADIILTDAYFSIISDVKQGRLVEDSLKWTHLPGKYKTFFSPSLDKYLQESDINNFIISLEPTFKPYRELKVAIKSFVLKMDTFNYTRVSYPYVKTNPEDSLYFVKTLHQRLRQCQPLEFEYSKLLDSSELAKVVKKYQALKGLEADGKINSTLVNHLNLTDKEKLYRIFVSLDRYKLLADSMPNQLIWVNLPSYTLRLYNKDSIELTSKIVCGRTYTPTPILQSEVHEMVVYPTWTVPPGIVRNEMLPGLRRNSGYLSRRGLRLYDQNGNRVNPGAVNWSKYSKGIPFSIVQGSGESNALGAMKFNFENPYYVYLHDTNQKEYFNNSMRALSHGCVRVQEWKALSYYIARNDSIFKTVKDTMRYNTDSLTNWLAEHQHKRIAVVHPIKVYLQYVTCEGENGTVRFYDDMYGEDRKMIDKFFTKKVN